MHRHLRSPRPPEMAQVSWKEMAGTFRGPNPVISDKAVSRQIQEDPYAVRLIELVVIA